MSQNNKITILVDEETIDLMQKMYPELISAGFNVAIKKFAETKEFQKYFLKKEFRDEVIVKETDEEIPEIPNTPKPEQKSVPVSEPESNVLDFSSWG